MMNNHLVSVEEVLKHGVTGEYHDTDILLKCSTDNSQIWFISV